MSTTCKDAIALFADSELRNPDKVPPEEATQVKLYFMKPPITKLDPAALAQLKACTHLALSSNSIEKMCNLGALENLEILSMGRNKLRKIENLDSLGDTLEQLWLSYNQISSTNGIDKLKKLKVLYLGNNNISDMKEVQKLANIETLEEIVLYGNPIHKKIIDDGELAWPTAILKVLPNLKRLDGISCVEWKMKISEGNDKELKQLFDAIDTDGSGDLDLGEIKAALMDDDIRREIGVAKGKAEEVFEQMGGDGQENVGITFEQFLHYFSTKQDLATLF